MDFIIMTDVEEEGTKTELNLRYRIVYKNSL